MWIFFLLLVFKFSSSITQFLSIPENKQYFIFQDTKTILLFFIAVYVFFLLI